MMENFVATQMSQNKDFKNQNIHISEVLRQLSTKVDGISTHSKMLETQIRSSCPTSSFCFCPSRIIPGTISMVLNSEHVDNLKKEEVVVKEKFRKNIDKLKKKNSKLPVREAIEIKEGVRTKGSWSY